MTTHIRICAIDIDALIRGLRHHGLIVADEPTVMNEFYDVAVDGPRARIDRALETLLANGQLIADPWDGAVFVRPPVA
jgi:hypothetical protein